MIRIPSVKTLLRIPRVTEDEAKAIRGWLLWGTRQAQEHPTTSITAGATVAAWANSCYCRPGRLEIAMAYVAHVLTEGRTTVWEVFQNQESWPSYFDGPSWEAIEVGDPYINTLIHRNGNFSVGAWGDLPEVNR